MREPLQGQKICISCKIVYQQSPLVQLNKPQFLPSIAHFKKWKYVIKNLCVARGLKK